MENSIKVKICCISNMEEAYMAMEFGASALGLVGHMPSGPGAITDELIKEIAGQIPPQIATFLLTSETSAEKIILHHQKTGTNTIQIVDRPENGAYGRIKEALPYVRLVQVIHVIDKRSVEEAIDISDQVDALLLDSGNPHLKVKELGGTGRTHDWELSKQIVDGASVPVFLAGGLNPENVQEAVEKVQPWGVDLCSGLRTNGALDPLKLEKFFNALP